MNLYEIAGNKEKGGKEKKEKKLVNNKGKRRGDTE
jgi:hypothetical protein